MKKKQDAPEELVKALNAEAELLSAWNALRPSCRTEYTAIVAEAKNAEARKKAVQKVIKLTTEYYKGHPEKHKTPSSTSRLKRPLYPMPEGIRKALINAVLLEAYNSRPPYQRNDYIGWITRAKREETRHKRLSQMLDELEGGKFYMNMAYHAGQKAAKRAKTGMGNRK
ncbi:MAG: YdeI/OmpD-associated family protein [Nitrospinae bacterium]|nr:YdeI/OmpD-associated family protein [Nitrospinota bacterium]